MKRLVNKSAVIVLILFLGSCKTQKASVVVSLFEVLSQQDTGGAKIEFYETITEKSEMMMLLGDKNLKGKVKKDDIEKSNFVILNMGEKPSTGYAISVQKVLETKDSVFVTIKQKIPKPREIVTKVTTTPFYIIKINSKKGIAFK